MYLMYNIYYEQFMTEDVEITYEQLDLQVGQIIQVSLGGESTPAVFHNAMLVGAVDNECIMFRDVEEGASTITDEQAVVVRIILPDGVARFSSVVLCVSDEPLSIVYLKFPDCIKFKLIRRAKRMPVSLPFLASNLTTESSSIIDGSIEDISSGGAGLIVDGYLGEIGEKISIRFVFKMEGKSRYLSMNARIRSFKNGENGQSLYGIKFKEDEGDDILLLFGFIFYATSFGSAHPSALPIELKEYTE